MILQDLSSPLLSLDGCKSLCGAAGGLWPKPEHAKLGRNVAPITIETTSSFHVQELPKSEHEGQLRSLLDGAFAIFVENVDALKENDTSAADPKTNLLKISVTLKQDDVNLDLQTAEDYHLEVSTGQGEVKAKVVASTFFGARHALETLSQLISFDSGVLAVVSSASVMDRPKYPYRGLLLDTGRNYFSVAAIKRVIRGMSYDKLNVLHWHMNEQQSFPFVSESVPELTRYGAYSQS